MPHINKIRINGLSYNDGNNLIEDLTLNFLNESATYEAINGAGKSFIMLCLLQTVLPNSYLVKELPFKNVFNGRNATKVAHVLVEWTLDSNPNYKYLLTGFCARKKIEMEKKEPRNNGDLSEDYSSMDYYNYMIFYNSHHEYDINNFNLYEELEDKKNRIGYEKLKSNLVKYRDKNTLNSNIQVGIFSPKETHSINDYKKNLALYNILDTEWEILRKINNGEVSMSDYFRNFTSPESLILKFLIPEIIEKSYMWKTNTNYQNSQKLAKTLLEMKDQLKELSLKREIADEYDYMVSLVGELLNHNEKLESLYSEKMSQEEKLCRVINYLSVKVKEFIELKSSIEEVGIELQKDKLEIENKQDGLTIKLKENEISSKSETVERIEFNHKLKQEESDSLKHKREIAKVDNEYLKYKKEMYSYNEFKNKKENLEKDFKELTGERDYYGTIYSYHIKEQIRDSEEKLTELRVQSDDLNEKYSTNQDSLNKLLGKQGELTSSINNLNKTVESKNKTTDELRKKLFSLGCFNFFSDVEITKKQLSTMLNKEVELKNEINRIPNRITELTGDKKLINSELETLSNVLKKSEHFLGEYNIKKCEYDKLIPKYQMSGELKLSDFIHEEEKKASDEDRIKKEHKNKLLEKIGELKRNKPLSKHSELLRIYGVIRSKYGSAELGIDNIDEISNKENLLKNNILVPYAIVLSSTEFKAFKRDTAIRKAFGDLAIPVLNREAVRAYEKLDLAFLDFSTKPLEVFLNEDLIKRELEDKTKELLLVMDMLATLENTLKQLDTDFKVSTRFEEGYPLDFEESVRTEIIDYKNRIDVEKQKLSKLNGEIETLEIQLKEKEENKANLETQITEKKEIISDLETFIQIDKELTIDEGELKNIENQADEAKSMINELKSNLAKLKELLVKIQPDIIKLQLQLGALGDLYNKIISNINLKDISLEESRNTDINLARGKYEAAVATLQSRNVDLKLITDTMDKHFENAGGILNEIVEYYKYNLEFFITRELVENINYTDINAILQMDNEVKALGDELLKLNNQVVELRKEIEILIEGENGVEEFKRKYQTKYEVPYDEGLFKSIDDLNRYGYELKGNFLEISNSITLNEKQSRDNEKNLSNFEGYKNNAVSIRDALEIKVITKETDDDINFIWNCNEEIKANNKKILDIKISFNSKVSTAKEKFSNANISNFMQELNDLQPADSMEGTKLQIEMMKGEEGYLVQIQKEKEEIDKKIAELMQLKENFINICSQRCDEVFYDLKKLQDLSKIEIHGIKTDMIRIDIKNIPEDSFRKYLIGAYIESLVEGIDNYTTTLEKEKYLQDRLSISNLFRSYYNNLDRWEVYIYKVEDLQEHSRYLRWVNAIGSTGQTNIIYLGFVICLISYIRKLYSSSSDNTKKVILADNPFGASGAAYLYRPLFELLKNNNVQFICPGFNIHPSLLGLFKINYQLGQKLSNNGKISLMVESVRAEKKNEDSEYYFSGTQVGLFEENM